MVVDFQAVIASGLLLQQKTVSQRGISIVNFR